MPTYATLRLVSSNDTLVLDFQERFDYGIQVLAGVKGLGLPPVQPLFIEGAGDGSVFRGRRVLSRDIDLPLNIKARSRDELKDFQSRLSRMMSGVFSLQLIEGREEYWYTDCYRVGGGDYSYGFDTRGSVETVEVSTVLTLRCPEPYFQSSLTQSLTITADSAKGLIAGGSLVTLQLSASQAQGAITLVNNGDADAYPVWKAYGPGSDFRVISSTGEEFRWTGSLTTGQVLTVDTRNGTVTRENGSNQYGSLASNPKLFTIPPGTTSASVSMLGTTPGVSKIGVEWRARRWAII